MSAKTADRMGGVISCERACVLIHLGLWSMTERLLMLLLFLAMSRQVLRLYRCLDHPSPRQQSLSMLSIARVVVRADRIHALPSPVYRTTDETNQLCC